MLKTERREKQTRQSTMNEDLKEMGLDGKDALSNCQMRVKKVNISAAFTRWHKQRNHFTSPTNMLLQNGYLYFYTAFCMSEIIPSGGLSLANVPKGTGGGTKSRTAAFPFSVVI